MQYRKLSFTLMVCCIGFLLPAVSQPLDIQGHRGCRGLFPENSIPGFLHAIKLGVTTIELDVVVTADKQVIVSHEPWINPEICLVDESKGVNLFQISYSEVAEYDCGSKGHPKFPDQKAMATHKPLLKDVILAVNSLLAAEQLSPVKYNIELKSTVETDGTHHPPPEEFTELVHSVLDPLVNWKLVTIQSFDYRTLIVWHERYPAVSLAALTSYPISPKKMQQTLGFLPHIYSPNHSMLTKGLLKEYQQLGTRVIPWTVNNPYVMQKLIRWGVDGLISDYPDKLVSLVKP